MAGAYAHDDAFHVFYSAFFDAHPELEDYILSSKSKGDEKIALMLKIISKTRPQVRSYNPREREKYVRYHNMAVAYLRVHGYPTLQTVTKDGKFKPLPEPVAPAGGAGDVFSRVTGMTYTPAEMATLTPVRLTRRVTIPDAPAEYWFHMIHQRGVKIGISAEFDMSIIRHYKKTGKHLSTGSIGRQLIIDHPDYAKYNSECVALIPVTVMRGPHDPESTISAAGEHSDVIYIDSNKPSVLAVMGPRLNEWTMTVQRALSELLIASPEEGRLFASGTCPDPACTFHDSPFVAIKNAFSCIGCKKRLCKECIQFEHTGFPCGLTEEERSAIVVASMSKPCPTCSAPISRTHGCSHMVCTCGTHFCWDCGVQVEALRPYRHNGTMCTAPEPDTHWNPWDDTYYPLH